MGSIYVDSPIKDMRLTIRYVLTGRKIWIKSLPLHSFSLVLEEDFVEHRFKIFLVAGVDFDVSLLKGVGGK
jgi:alkylation response protein AidB-like acyl-CoA dehydrogenase